MLTATQTDRQTDRQADSNTPTDRVQKYDTALRQINNINNVRTQYL